MMSQYYIFVSLCIFFNDVFSVYGSSRYDVVLIPVASFELPARSSDTLRLDITPYEPPTSPPDIDNVHQYDDDDSHDDHDHNNNNNDDNNNDYDNNNDDERKRIAKTGDAQEPQLDELADDKIVGGQEVDINLYPYHVAYGSNCGGALIDAGWALTAAHCGSKPYVRVGSKYLGQGQKIEVSRNFIHPGWSLRNKAHPFDYDFQLLQLARNAELSSSVQPIPLAHVSNMVIGAVVSVTGWGNTRENGPYSRVLRAVRVPIISKENCQRVPFPYFRGMLTPRMFCAGYSEGKKDACQGDSGGPAVSDGKLMGMVSFGYGCATPGSYGVYSKVANVRKWIETTSGLRLN